MCRAVINKLLGHPPRERTVSQPAWPLVSGLDVPQGQPVSPLPSVCGSGRVLSLLWERPVPERVLLAGKVAGVGLLETQACRGVWWEPNDQERGRLGAFRLQGSLPYLLPRHRTACGERTTRRVWACFLHFCSCHPLELLLGNFLLHRALLAPPLITQRAGPGWMEGLAGLEGFAPCTRLSLVPCPWAQPGMSAPCCPPPTSSSYAFLAPLGRNG